jgi:hypothetical protein
VPELIADPTQPSLSVQVLPWNAIVSDVAYEYPGELTGALTVPATGTMCYGVVFVKNDYASTEITYSTAIPTTGRDLDVTDRNECLAAKTDGSIAIRAIKLVGDQAAITQADLDNDSVPLQQVVNTAQTGGSSPLTTKGDVYTYDSADARLAVGTNNYVLTADSAQAKGIKWALVSLVNIDYRHPGRC